MTTDSTRPARPWDLFNKNIGRVQDTIAAERLAFCNECPHYSANVLKAGGGPFIRKDNFCTDCGCNSIEMQPTFKQMPNP